MTPHIEANPEDIAKIVIMPGDPNRVKFIAENYLKNKRLVNQVRGILAYTGTYKGKEITVMASGMGMPSIGIYATELFNVYKVDKIIRVGTCGGLNTDVKVNDILLAKEVYTNSNFAHSLTGQNANVTSSSLELNQKILEKAKELDINVKPSTICTSDIFYTEYQDPKVIELNCQAVEMETFALLFLAKHFNKEASSILTVSDNLITHEELTPEERETKLKKAIVLALEAL